jgi:hypothetical protein
VVWHIKYLGVAAQVPQLPHILVARIAQLNLRGWPERSWWQQDRQKHLHSLMCCVTPHCTAEVLPFLLPQSLLSLLHSLLHCLFWYAS